MHQSYLSELFRDNVGVWGALNNNSSTSDLQTLETVAPAAKKPTTVTIDVSEEIPRAFGQGRGRGFGGRSAGMSKRVGNPFPH